jgi:uncharacterized protein (TIGR02231 family)
MLIEAIGVAETQKALMVNLASLPARPEPPNSAGGARTPAEWSEIFTLIGERLQLANRTIQETRLALRAVDKSILEVQSQLNRQPTREEERTEVRIRLGAEAALEATLRIRYQVPAASWSPIYDARLETGDAKLAPKLSLVRRAVIVQHSGEDWKDVNLTLSTTQPQAGTAAPELNTLIVDFELPPPKPSAMMKRKAKEEEELRGDGGAGQLADAPVPESAPPSEPVMTSAGEAGANVIVAPFQAIYVIGDRQTIKTGEGEKRVQIDARALEPVLSIRTVPKVAEVAYLYASLKVEEGLLLLPGRASLFRDGVFVGHGWVPMLSSGEEHELGFGGDDQIRVDFAAVGRKTGETGLISASTTESLLFKATIRNAHERAVSVRVLDQLPVSENEEIQVALLPASTKPSLANVEDKRGVLAWDLRIEPGGEEVVNFGYQVSWPKDRRVRYEHR